MRLFIYRSELLSDLLVTRLIDSTKNAFASENDFEKAKPTFGQTCK